MHLPGLLVGLAIMVGGNVYPVLFAAANGRADHGQASVLFWAMRVRTVLSALCRRRTAGISGFSV